MSGGAGLDIRLPIGGLFTLLGLVLAGYGLATAGDAADYARSLSVDVNLWWGAVMVVFGIAMLWGARKPNPRDEVREALTTPEGRATEEREHELGLEK